MPGFAIDRMCAGAMTTVTMMAGSIGFGMYDLAIAGGVEHMGHHPMGSGVDPNPRFLSERLVGEDALNMGATAERIHDRFPQLTKERSDRYGLASQQKTAAAYDAGKIQPDLVPVAIRTEAGWGLATRDEVMRPETTLEGLAALKTPFRPHGRVTAGNASGLNDGATAAILASGAAAKELGLTPEDEARELRLRRRRPRDHGHRPDPVDREGAPKAGLTIDDIDLFELNEAFAVQVLSFLDHFGIADDDPRVNPWGGAIAVGHPLASSGVRLMNQLASQFTERPDVRYGLTACASASARAASIIWENPNFNKKAKKAMTDYSTIDFDSLVALAGDDEVVTHSYVRDIPLTSGKTLALITLDNGRDHTRPNTLGPATLLEYARRSTS